MKLVFRRALRHALRAGALGLALGSNAWAAPAKPVPPELPAETLEASTLQGVSTARVYVADVAISHISDGRIRVFDAVRGKVPAYKHWLTPIY